ncbi:MAG TPA: segregation/condensation protein A [Desulfomonilaceae bacterium]|nr:segregation/condensation protein A [Desulfomonilaceae bacterium]
MSYEVKLEVFEGPLDLLLHLINRNELSITDIPMALITQQYLETIELMKSLNLEVAGEYLVMAAYLTHIKSQMLLPLPEEDQEGTECGQDPRDELVAHLLEYKRYKEASENLGALSQLDRDVFVRESSEDIPDSSRARQPLDVGLPELLNSLRELLARTSRRDLIELEPERLHVQDKIHEIMERLDSVPQITFNSLFQGSASRVQILTTFLALLEVMKLQLVRVYQDEPFGTILIAKRFSQNQETTPIGISAEGSA